MTTAALLSLFLCVNGCVSYLCNFSQGRDWQEKEQSVCVCLCVCERERESHIILCSTLQLQHGGIWPQPIRTMPSSSTFLSWSAFISIQSFTSHMMSLLNLWMHLPLPQHPLWFFLLLFFYYQKDCCIRIKSPNVWHKLLDFHDALGRLNIGLMDLIV